MMAGETKKQRKKKFGKAINCQSLTTVANFFPKKAHPLESYIMCQRPPVFKYIWRIFFIQTSTIKVRGNTFFYFTR